MMFSSLLDFGGDLLDFGGSVVGGIGDAVGTVTDFVIPDGSFDSVGSLITGGFDNDFSLSGFGLDDAGSIFGTVATGVAPGIPAGISSVLDVAPVIGGTLSDGGSGGFMDILNTGVGAINKAGSWIEDNPKTVSLLGNVADYYLTRNAREDDFDRALQLADKQRDKTWQGAHYVTPTSLYPGRTG